MTKASPYLLSSLLVILCCGCNRAGAQRDTPVQSASPVTNFSISDTTLQTGVQRFGINIPGENLYDSGQITRNLVMLNPGFEGETWQSILQCKKVTATSCMDANQWAQWPANFMKDATYEFISGAAAGQTGVIVSSDAAYMERSGQGINLHFAATGRPHAVDDFIVVKKTIPGNPIAGWKLMAQNQDVVSPEYSDLAPNTPGKQAVRIMAAGPGQNARISCYFDSLAGHSFVQLKGQYRLTFRAKGLGGANRISVHLVRQTEGPQRVFLDRQVNLSKKWQDYTLDFNATENRTSVGTIDLSFFFDGSNVLFDDVSLAMVPTPGAANPTVFRDEVVATLKALRPGILRYNDGSVTGSSIDNLLAPAFARVRAGASEQQSLAEEVTIGLPEFLQLCETVGADPYFVMPPAMSEIEAKNLIEYLSGPATTTYGKKRAEFGHPTPWTSVFSKIHMELGNEQWNTRTFPGSSIGDPATYGKRAKQIFLAARSSPAYSAEKFDLILGSFAVNPDWTRVELANSAGYDSTAVAPYLFNELNDTSSKEAIFGPMFAQPEMVDSLATGYMAQQAKEVKRASHPTNLVIYEVNLSTLNGTADQSQIDSVVPSVAAGITLIDHMLLMLRDLGIKNQSTWALSGYGNQFRRHHPDDSPNGTANTPLFGMVVDMGGSTGLRRPQYLAEKLANQAILPNMLKIAVTGRNPTWHQPKSKNDSVEIDRAHLLQMFAFADGPHHSVIALNLSRTESLPVTFSGAAAPSGKVHTSRLTAKNITDSNEVRENVSVVEGDVNNFTPATPYLLPPYSMTVLEWETSH